MLMMPKWREGNIHLCESCGQELPPRRNCAHCGKSFAYGPGTGKRKTARFCSDRCRLGAWNKRRIEEGQKGND
jgi:endogenous inhibitor of DNA gyrase (YacG/DUF329 family)